MILSIKFYLTLDNVLRISGALHYRLYELKKIHGIEDGKPLTGATVPQTISSGLLCMDYGCYVCIRFFFFFNLNFDIELNAAITLNCIGASMGEKPPLTKKLPATTTVEHEYYSSNVMFSLS